MQIQYTQEEYQKLLDISSIYSKKKADLENAIAEESDTEKRSHLTADLHNLIGQHQTDLDAFFEECQQAHFKEIEHDPSAILANAKEQIPDLLRSGYRAYTEVATSEFLDLVQKDGDVAVKDGKVLLTAKAAQEILNEELKYHIVALQNNPEKLRELFTLIGAGIAASEYTTGEGIEIRQDALDIALSSIHYRRSPLAEITNYGLMNDNATAQLIRQDGVFAQKADGQLRMWWEITEGTRGKKDPVMSYIALSYQADGTEWRMTKKLTAFDSAVYNAVATRFYYWRVANPQKPLYITPHEIWRTMNGKRSGDGNAKPRQTQIDRICASLDKMRFTRFYMNISAELKAFDYRFNDERIVNGIIDTYLLESDRGTFTTEKGNTVSGYIITREPILYTYNSAKDHILFVPYEMLDTAQTTSDTTNVTEFRNYLLQQIQLMKNAAKEKKKPAKERKPYFERDDKIKIDTIYMATGLPSPEDRAASSSFTSESARNTYIRKTRKADRDKIEGILNAWKMKNWIKDFIPLDKKNRPLVDADHNPIKERVPVAGYRIVLGKDEAKG